MKPWLHKQRQNNKVLLYGTLPDPCLDCVALSSPAATNTVGNNTERNLLYWVILRIRSRSELVYCAAEVSNPPSSGRREFSSYNIWIYLVHVPKLLARVPVLLSMKLNSIWEGECFVA